MSEHEEEAARRLAEELRNLKVEDVLLNVLVQISSIGYRRLGLTEAIRFDHPRIPPGDPLRPQVAYRGCSGCRRGPGLAR